LALSASQIGYTSDGGRTDRPTEVIHNKVDGVDMRLRASMYPSLVTTDSPIVKAILRASEVMLGKPAETYYSPSAFDQGYLNHVGIVTANSAPANTNTPTPITTWPRSSAPPMRPRCTPS
jgi:hypothetical protein